MAAHIFLAPRIPAPTDPGQPGSPSGAAGTVTVDPVVAPPRRAPKPPPVFDPEPEWYGITHEWVDTNGKVWNLTNPDGGVFLTRGGLRGLDWPGMNVYTDEGPTLPGAIWRGALTKPRDVFWPILLYGESGSDDWLETDFEWWDGLDPRLEGTWRVRLQRGETRSLRCRHTPRGDVTFDRDPVKFGWQGYGVNLTAYQPMWEGATRRTIARNTERPNFFGPTGFGPPFYVASSSAASTVSVTNYGDVDTHVRWGVWGPTTSARVGVRGRHIVIPFPVPDGQVLLVDPRPGAQTAIMHRVVVTNTENQVGARIADRTADLGGNLPDWNGSMVGRRERQRLDVVFESDGNGYVSADITSLYWRGLPRPVR